MASADLLLHPVRLRIVQAFLGDRALTTSALAGELADVPPASLYRHVAKLVRAGVHQGGVLEPEPGDPVADPAADRYLSREHIDPLRDGVSYRIAGFWLDDAEYADLV